MNLSPQGTAFLQTWEQLRRTPYPDQTGKWTVGYGHLILPGEPGTRAWTDDEINAAFIADTAYHSQVVSNIAASLTQQQFDACVCLSYNIGAAGFMDSTVARRLVAADYSGAALAFLMWIKVTVNGRKVRSKGLMARRAAELLVFTNGDYEAEYA